MTILELVEEYLKRPENSGFGIRSYDGECGCTIDELAPCGDMKHDCELGQIVAYPNGCANSECESKNEDHQHIEEI